MQTWKFSIKPDSEPNLDAFTKCKELGIVGIGWHHGYAEKQPQDAEEALRLRQQMWPGSDVREIGILFDDIKPGDHLWMQKYGHYYLCVAGTRRYVGREICADFNRYDLGHAIEARWIQVPDELVSGSIQRGIIARRMIQRINLSAMETKLNLYIEQNLTGDDSWFPCVDVDAMTKALEGADEEALFALLSPDDVEDIVAAKLQTEGWVLLKSTCFRSKPQFEFSMLNADGVTGCVQVKSGRWPDTLKPAAYGEYVRGDRRVVFLFSTHPSAYPGEAVRGVHCIGRSDIVNWMKRNPNLLAATVRLKLTLQAG